ncbi:MAG: DNA polymerase I [Flavobacteriales bacterium]|nr:DNA polymerase I [Flavobacteriales bacterium]
MAEEKKLFLLDAFALIYRAYFAFSKNPRYSSTGMNTSAVLGFTNTLYEVLRKEKPTHIAVVFDLPGVGIREEYYTEYKANREKMPEDISIAIPYIKRVIEGFNIPIIASEGYEADDVIGTLAKMAEKKGFQTYMMTPDKDFGQLVSENIFMYRPGRGGGDAEVWGIPEICKKFDIEHPLQVIDILGLWGDAVDNIPGIPGIGEKTSKILIKKYGSIEKLLENTEDLKGKQKENVENNKEQALMSKRLATILLDAPVELNEKELLLKEPNAEALTKLFSELEFRTLAQRILGTPIKVAKEEGQMDLFSSAGADEAAAPKEFKNIENTEHQYNLISIKEGREFIIKELSLQKQFCFDTETTGIDPQSAEIVGISFSFRAHHGYYIPLSEDFEEAKAVLAEFKELFANPKVQKIGQNIKYDISILKRYDIEVVGDLFDTMLAHYLIQPDQKHNMDLLAETYLNYSLVSIESLIGKKGRNQKTMRDIAPEEVKEYATEDADITYQLSECFKPLLKEHGLEKLFNEVEVPLIPVLANMEAEGIMLDTKALLNYSKELEIDIQRIQADVLKLAGQEFNLASPKQLGEILFDVLKIDDKAKKTKTGQYATGEEVLAKLEGKHEIIPQILDFRSLSKLKSTYVDALPEMVNARTNHVHTSYLQTVAATGRLSSINPNLQNIPIRSDRGREVRKAFIPRSDEFTLFCADYSQVELRIMAELSGDTAMIDAFKNKVDIHSATASKVYHVDLNDVDDTMRRNAKMVNFGIIYGISAFGLAQRLNIKRGEAKEIIESYFDQYPKIKEYMELIVEKAREQGYVETILGRKRHLKDINSHNGIVRGFAERNAINAPIQGSAADIIKIAMININKIFKEKNFKSKMLLQVHDELVFDLYKEEEGVVEPIVIDCMENSVKMTVPLIVESGKGVNWLLAH